MHVTDLDEQLHVRRIADEQAQVIDYVARVNRGQVSDETAGIPTVSTFPPGATQRYRYVVIVEVRDPITGDTIGIPIEMLEDAPITAAEARLRATEAVMERQYGSKYRNRISETEEPAVVQSRVISISRRA